MFGISLSLHHVVSGLHDQHSISGERERESNPQRGETCVAEGIENKNIIKINE